METAIKGRGYISVQARAWSEIGSPETPEQWHKALLLPEDYEIERIERDRHVRQGELFGVFVRHEDIPIIGDHTPMPEIKPLYTRTEDGTTALSSIEIWHWDGHWKKKA
jgi:hypothetical protein